MSLTESEKFHSRYDGGKALGNKKRHLAQIKSALLKLCVEAENGVETLGGFGERDLTTLRDAARLVGRLEADYAKDAQAAQRIKTEFDAAIKAASQALRAMVRDPIGDVIALHVIANPRDLTSINELTIATKSAPGWLYGLEQLQRQAIADLSHQIVRSGQPPSIYCAALDLDSVKNHHAGLIAQIKAHAVAQKLKAAA